MTRVLIVDDDRDIRETVRSALEDARYSVVEAGDGLNALRILRESGEPMVVLLDLMMPSLDGAGVLGAVAGDHRLSTRFSYVLVTASHKTLPLAFVNLLTNLKTPILNKPFDLDTLLDVVHASAQRLPRQ